MLLVIMHHTPLKGHCLVWSGWSENELCVQRRKGAMTGSSCVNALSIVECIELLQIRLGS